MTIYYVGPGGADGNNGLTWALRKLTLNGVEDIPVVAGDTVYVGPGVYRESLTIDVSGVAGSPITYIGDISGENTDDVGGVVRITGSDNDQIAARGTAVSANTMNYRTFRGLHIDICSTAGIDAVSCTFFTIEDCTFESQTNAINSTGAGQSDFFVHRCWFWGTQDSQAAVRFLHTVAVDDSNHLVENCFFSGGYAVVADDVGCVLVNFCTFMNCSTGLIQWGAIAAGQEAEIYNCLLIGCNRALWATAGPVDLIEDYNTFYANGTDRQGVNIGVNSIAYPALLVPPVLLDGTVYPRIWGNLNEWSQVSRRYDAFEDAGLWGIYAGISVIQDDLFGIYRPVGVSLQSWGAIQLREGERETGTVRTGTAAINLDSAGDHQIFVPVTNVSTTIEVYVYREANYEGLAPQMIIRQPGQEDEVATDIGASAAWNQLTKTLTPAADPPYVCVILRSHNEALAGNFDVFFDDLDVS